MYHKMDTVIEMAKDSQVQLVTVKEKQIGGLAAISNLQSGFQSHENRITNLERMALDLRNPQSK